MMNSGLIDKTGPAPGRFSMRGLWSLVLLVALSGMCFAPLRADNKAIDPKLYELTAANPGNPHTGGGAVSRTVTASGGTWTSPEIQITPGVNPMTLAWKLTQASSNVSATATFLYSNTSGQCATCTDQSSASPAYTTSLTISQSGTTCTGGTPFRPMPYRFMQVVVTNNAGVDAAIARLPLYVP